MGMVAPMSSIVQDDRKSLICGANVPGKGMSAALLTGVMRTSLCNARRFNDHISPSLTIDCISTSLIDDFTEMSVYRSNSSLITKLKKVD